MSRPKKALKSKASPKDEEPPEDLMERFHEKKVCKIIPTTPGRKKDIFSEYRPKSPRECMNYNISQTDAKMDAGPTKIHVQQTRAAYEPYPDGLMDEPPPPPVKRKKRPSHGRGPVWLFLDEEWKRKVDFEQEIYKREMEARIKRKIKTMKTKRKGDHQEMLKRVGPDWFQELSPDQRNAVDNLAGAIKKDIIKGTIINTQECIAKLGLVLRPNHHHVEVALKHCCENPVEFILILYQLMNPNRKHYTLNDRLLLSSVAHLSMRSVLRELHIRIPSPPRAPKPQHKQEKIKKPYIKYKSPYLVPYTFVPDPQKHTGVYENRHIQYPESPYFSYLEELREELAKCMPDEAGDESGFTTRSRKGIPCKETDKLSEEESMMTSLEAEITEELEAAQKKYSHLPHYKHPRKLLRPSIYRPCEKSLELFGYRTGIYDQAEQYSKNIAVNTCISLDRELGIAGEYQDLEESVSKYEYMMNIQNHQPKFIIAGIVIGRHGESIPVIGGVVPGILMDCKCTRKKSAITCENENGTESSVNAECHCEEKEREREEMLKKELEKCTCWPDPVEDISSSTISISNIGSFVRAPSESDDDVKEKLVEVKKPKTFNCGCKQMVDIVLDCAEKEIECAEICEEKRSAPTFIVADTKLDEAEDAIPIIAGVKAQAKCDCLQKYQRKIAKYEEIKTTLEVQDTLKSCNKKFLIGGVTTGPDGKPVYILSGISPERPCKKCEEMIEWKKREEQRIANIPDSKQFPQKFVISGVHQSPVGNVYVLSGVAPTKECDCMKLYHAYMDRHAMCMDLYDRYVAKMNKETEEYLSELSPDECEQSSEIENCPCFEPSYSEDTEESDEELDTPDSSSTISSAEMEGLESVCLGCGKAFSDCEDIGEDDEIPITVECHCDEYENMDDVPIKRFIVLDKIPCNPKKQMAIIQKALASMAKDGFPLAKLPQVHKLPYFKLWMALRCGKYWTMEDRERLYFLSKYYWRHLDKCETHLRSPRLKMSNERAWTFTWASAKYIRKITDNVIEQYYRKAKQGIIADGREFFPSMFDYELPTKTFRDCYFAYVPGKEEAAFTNRPWKVFEFIDYKLIRIKNSKRKCIR